MPFISQTGFDAKSNKIINVAAAVNPNDVPNFGQLSAAIQGVSWHAPVQAAATTNVATLSGLTAVDGITPVSGVTRILLTAQTTASQNGLWVANSGAWTRPADSTSGSTTAIANGHVVEVGAGGTSNGNTLWRVTTQGAITVDTTATTWSQIPTSAGQTYSAGSGLALTASTFSVNADGTSIIADGTSTRVNPAWSALPGRYANYLPAIAASSSATITHGLGSIDIEWSFQDLTGGAGTGFPTSYDVSQITTTTMVVTTGANAVAASTVRIAVWR